MSEPQVRFYRMPAEGPITGRFGQDYGSYLHRGVDIGCPVGTPVRAPAKGRVVQPFNDGSFGIAVCLDHGDGWYSLYAHLSRADVEMGQRVPAGLQLGLSGNTGASTGPHCHWQLSDSPTFPTDINRSRDPLAYFSQEEPMTNSERGLIAIAAELDNDPRLFDTYDTLAANGYVPPQSGDDLNAYLRRRFGIIALAASDQADAAYRSIGGKP